MVRRRALERRGKLHRSPPREAEESGRTAVGGNEASAEPIRTTTSTVRYRPSQPRSANSVSKRTTSSRSTCRSSPMCQSRCSPALVSERSTTSSLRGLLPMRSSSESTRRLVRARYLRRQHPRGDRDRPEAESRYSTGLARGIAPHDRRRSTRCESRDVSRCEPIRLRRPRRDARRHRRDSSVAEVDRSPLSHSHVRDDRRPATDDSRDRGLPRGCCVDGSDSIRPLPKDHDLVYSRYQVDYRPLLRRLRAASLGRNGSPRGGESSLSGSTPAVGVDRTKRRGNLLHDTRSDSDIYEMGRVVSLVSRPVVVATARYRR